MAVITEIKSFFDHGPAIRLASAKFVPEPENNQEKQPEKQINTEKMQSGDLDHGNAPFVIDFKSGICQ